jgi:uncharacterized protein (DUF2342 family)
MEGLNRVWTSPQALPTTSELQAPDAWLERIRTKELKAAV